MSSILKCFQADGILSVVFDDEIDINSFTTDYFTISSGTITSISGEGYTASITFEGESRPLIVSCNVKNLNGDSFNLSKAVLLEYNYKVFPAYIDMCNYYLNTPDSNLDGKIYYDVVDGKLYYDDMGQNFASDLNNFVLVYSLNNSEYLEPLQLSNGVIIGWQSPKCREYIDNAWSFN